MEREMSEEKPPPKNEDKRPDFELPEDLVLPPLSELRRIVKEGLERMSKEDTEKLRRWALEEKDRREGAEDSREFWKDIKRGEVYVEDREFIVGLIGIIITFALLLDWSGTEVLSAVQVQEFYVYILAATGIGSLGLIFHSLSLRPRARARRKEREELAKVIAEAIHQAFKEEREKEKQEKKGV
jgi:hypothetical protein